MALLPNRNILDGTKSPATTTSDMKTALGTLRDFLAALLGTDSSNTSAARTALGAAALAGSSSQAFSTAALTASAKISNSAGGAEFTDTGTGALVKLTRSGSGSGWIGADTTNAFQTYNGALTASAFQIRQTAPDNAVVISSTGMSIAGVASTTSNATSSGQVVRYDQVTTFTGATTPLPSAGSSVTHSHSLGRVPTQFQLQLVCLTAEFGYSSGDVVTPAAANSSTFPLVTWASSTQVGCQLVTTSGNSSFTLYNKSTGATATATAANWSVRFAIL